VLLVGAIFAPEGRFTTNDITGRIADLAAGILGVLVDVIGAADESEGNAQAGLFLSIWGVLLGGGALLMDFFLETDSFEWPRNILDDIADGLDISSVAIGGATVVLNVP
jgi:hypothetical protein